MSGPAAPAPQKKIPLHFILARYLGEYPVQLKAGMRAYRGKDNQPIKPHRRLNPATGKLEQVTLLYPGDVLMMPEAEVRGQTFLVDPSGQAPVLWLGVGFKPLPEHAGLSMQQVAGMRCMGPDGIPRLYELHEGRPDFQAVADEEEEQPAEAPAEAAAERSLEADADAEPGPSSSEPPAPADDPEDHAGDA